MDHTEGYLRLRRSVVPGLYLAAASTLLRRGPEMSGHASIRRGGVM